MKRLAWTVLSGVGAAVLFACGAGFASESGAPASALGRLSASDFAMPRYQIARDDSLLWIFNGRGKCNPPFRTTHEVALMWERRRAL